MSDRRIFGPQGHLRSGRLVAHKTQEAAFRAGAWFLAINGNQKAAAWAKASGLPIEKAHGESQNSVGGFLVPNELVATIIALRELRGAYRAAAQVVPLSSDYSSIPRRTGGLTAYFMAEATTITESGGTWDTVGLAPKKLATLSRSSSELDEDGAIDWGEWFVSEIAYAFASKEDDCGFNGDGTSAYSGIRGITNLLLDGSHNAGKVTAGSHSTFATVDTTDLAKLIGTAPSYALANARWFASNMGFALVFCRLAASAGGIVMQELNGRMVPHFMGWPVQITQALPQSTGSLTGQVMLCFGDLSQAATLGERRGVTVARSDQTFITQDQIAWRGTERVDIVNHDLGDNTTAGPIVGLVGA
ncbi:phage major capsid protein [Bradyrhizobium sp. 6(2017)]|uniref:phage major capsid protein n=1 Tax=Bradyrhizobium sp. 6(2017) TaxID=1197460 RepID=UPI0013E11ECB|nr:phage major capsid protein [Bradyrhizobium sp. 6(2017)]QIG92282.1 phage major capsid protein [Bradyrhizobium sp. 6(2017)]